MSESEDEKYRLDPFTALVGDVKAIRERLKRVEQVLYGLVGVILLGVVASWLRLIGIGK